MFNTIFGAGAVGAGAALCYGSGSDKKIIIIIRLLARGPTVLRENNFFTMEEGKGG
jgi:hypothetical protein